MKLQSNYDRAQRALDTVRERLVVPKVIDALGNRAEALAVVADMAEVPRVVDNELVAFDNWESRNVFAVVLIPRGVTYISRMTAPMPVQRALVLESMLQRWEDTGVTYSDGAVQGVNRSMTLPTYDQALTVQPQTVAEHVCPTIVLDESIAVRGRSHVIIASDQADKRLPGALLHECSHVLDVLPLGITREWTKEDYLRHRISTELAAYATEYTVARALNDRKYQWSRPSIPVGDLTVTLESIRQEYNGPYTSQCAFEPNERVIAALKEEGLLYLFDS